MKHTIINISLMQVRVAWKGATRLCRKWPEGGEAAKKLCFATFRLLILFTHNCKNPLNSYSAQVRGAFDSTATLHSALHLIVFFSKKHEETFLVYKFNL